MELRVVGDFSGHVVTAIEETGSPKANAVHSNAFPEVQEHVSVPVPPVIFNGHSQTRSVAQTGKGSTGGSLGHVVSALSAAATASARVAIASLKSIIVSSRSENEML
jgi:hypothetical protein